MPRHNHDKRMRAGPGSHRRVLTEIPYDVGTPMASVSWRMGPLYFAPGRATVDRRVRRPTGDADTRGKRPRSPRATTGDGQSRLPGVYVFTNDLPVFSPDAPDAAGHDDVYRTKRASGTAEVVCYHHDPHRSMADLTDDEITAVVLCWREQTENCSESKASLTF